MNHKETAAFVLKRAKELGADDIIVSVVEDASTQLKFSNSKVSVTQTWDQVDMGIFLAIGKKVGMTSLKDFNEEKVKATTKTLIEFVKKTKQNDDYYGIAKGPFVYKKISGIYDQKIQTVNQVDATESVINRALESGAKRVAGITEFSDRAVYITTSGNIEAEARTSLFHASIRSLVDKDATGHVTVSSRMFDKLEHLKAAEESGTIAKESVNPRHMPSGKYDVLFHPLAIAALLAITGSSASAFNVEAGLSFFNNQLKKKVGAETVTLRDDPTIPNSIGSLLFDAEGVPSQNTPIIQRGILQNYLHNTSTAHKYKTRTTASAGLVSPEPRNIILEGGDNTHEELIAGIKKGIIITNVWYTRFQNYADGQFSTIPRDGIFFVENGKVQHAVKGIRVSDNMLNVLKNIAALGKRLYPILSWETETPTTTPYVLVKEVNITRPVEKE